MKFSDMLVGVCLCVLMLVLSVQAGPKGGMGRNYLSGCRDRASTCHELSPSQCYSEEENFRCCRSCWNLSRQLSMGPGCQYGDRDVEVCRFVRGRHCASEHYQNICCKTCASFVSSLLG